MTKNYRTYSDRRSSKNQFRRESDELDPFKKFLKGADTESTSRAVDEYASRHFNNHRAQRIAGNMYVELAFRSENPSARLSFFEKGTSCWDNSLTASKAKQKYIDQDSGQTMLQQAYQNVYMWQILNPDTLPPQNISIDCHKRLLSVANTHKETLEVLDPKASSRTNQPAQLLAGNLALIETLLLANNFTMSLGDSSWVARPALFTEDRVDIQSANKSNAWNISVYTQLDPDVEPALGYKVKALISNKGKQADYGPDVIPISVCDDLAIPGRGRRIRRIPLGIITEEAMVVFNGCSSEDQQDRLSTRTEMLIDLIG